MKPSLQLSLTHQLTLTPRLQQSIRLLQLSTLDLQHEIQQQLESNPMLEAAPNDESDEVQIETHLEQEEEWVDFQWAPLYTSQNNNNLFNENDYIFETIHCTTTNLQDHLRWQLDLTPMTDLDRKIATTIIDAINDDGFLTLSLDDLHVSLNTQSHPLELEEIQPVLHRIQRFDPVGCGASNLAETLLIQLDQLPASTPYLNIAKQIIADNITWLGQHHYRQLMNHYHINELTLEKVIDLIQRLNPKPGNLIAQGITEYTTPDLFVKKINNLWHVLLNQNTLPRLSINTQYASLVKRANNSTDNQFLKNNLQEAHWFLKSIRNRQETLLNVARYIVDYQKDFLEFGEEAMKPLILHDIALALNMHESTISRVTTKKFIHTPRGLFELKYFFSSHILTKTGNEYSSVAVRALIKKLIAAENHKKPLSDNMIARLMGEQGIQIARRTVTKYREEMGIARSSERQSLC